MTHYASSAHVKAAHNSHFSQELSSGTALNADAIVFSGVRDVRLEGLELKPLTEGDLVIDVAWSGVSTGTERLLWSGEMPPFPGLSYPLVPGYEAVGRVVHSEAGPDWIGADVFVPGASCYQNAVGLFGGSASRLIIPEQRAVRLDRPAQPEDVLLALAATAHHAIAQGQLPDLVIGHGVLGRLIARLVIALGGQAPTVWETNPDRCDASGYKVIAPDMDARRDYASVCDASGSVLAIDTAIGHMAKGGELILAGFYADRVSFNFAPAFMRELRFRVAAEWADQDMMSVQELLARNTLSLDGLVTHVAEPANAQTAYETAFTQAACLKLVLDWSAYHDDTA